MKKQMQPNVPAGTVVILVKLLREASSGLPPLDRLHGQLALARLYVDSLHLAGTYPREGVRL